MAEPLAEDPHARFLRSRIGSLDGLRGVAILLVVGYHAHAHLGALFERGLGFKLFFTISGLLITTLLLREQERTGALDVRRFWIRRALRTFPLYYLVLALYVGLALVLERGTAEGQRFLERLPGFLTHTSNWIPPRGQEHVLFLFAWSLATQEQFYAVWPLALRAARVRWAPLALSGGLAVATLALEWVVDEGLVPAASPLGRLAGVNSSVLFVGAGVAALLHLPAGHRALGALVGARWSAPAAAAALAGAALVGLPDGLIGVAAGVLVAACAVRPDHGLRRVLEGAVLRHLGKVSYGVYLLHMLALNAVRRITPHSGAAVHLALGIPLAVAAATVSYRFVEEPFMALKDRFRPAAALAAPALPPPDARSAGGAR